MATQGGTAGHRIGKGPHDGPLSGRGKIGVHDVDIPRRTTAHFDTQKVAGTLCDAKTSWVAQAFFQANFDAELHYELKTIERKGWQFNPGFMARHTMLRGGGTLWASCPG